MKSLYEKKKDLNETNGSSGRRRPFGRLEETGTDRETGFNKQGRNVYIGRGGSSSAVGIPLDQGRATSGLGVRPGPRRPSVRPATLFDSNIAIWPAKTQPKK